MRPQEIIAKKRDGGELSADEIAIFVRGSSDGSWADYQLSALLMAIYIRGLSAGEASSLTGAMLESGEVLDFPSAARPIADKHSTGGVGDKTSIIVAPLAAACGLAVPMISGRGLGHTGGTLDKLEAIAGYNVNLTTDQIYSTVDDCGFAMAGQTEAIAPADKKLYSLRDATATVPYIPLIVASIMSKKLAEGLDVLVLDVKTGSGAFMTRPEDARALAESLVTAGSEFGVKTEALITDMDRPLGEYVGNGLEVFECLQILRGEVSKTSQPTLELSIELTARMLLLAGIESSIEKCRTLAESKISNGEALATLQRNIELQGGDPALCDNPRSLLADDIDTMPLCASVDGFLESIDTLAVGNALVTLGGGRTQADDNIDHAVGFSFVCAAGDAVQKGDVLGYVHCRSESQFDSIRDTANNLFSIASERPAPSPLVVDVVSS